MKDIPEYIIEWVSHTPFQQLDSTQRQEVLKHLSEIEYGELFAASEQARKLTHNELQELVPNAYIEQRLLHALAEKKMEKAAVIPIWKKNIPLWQVAASWLLMLGIGLILLQSKYAGTGMLATNTLTDTVYVEKVKEVPGSFIHDTVYLIKEKVQQAIAPLIKETSLPEKTSPTLEQIPKKEIFVSVGVPGTNILHLRDKDNPLNNKQGNSLLDDSLLKNFTFIRM